MSKKLITMFTVVFMLALAGLAVAFTAPAQGDFAYDIYDVAINKILAGPIGFVGGVAAIVLGALAVIRAQLMVGIGAILGGVFMLKADSIITSLGALIR